jgi:hypothetical protein
MSGIDGGAIMKINTEKYASSNLYEKDVYQ